MKTVRIIKGVYGYRPGPGKSTKPIYMGKTVDLPDAEADRLVGLGIAEYAGVAPEADEIGPEGVPAGVEDDGAGVNMSGGENGAEGQEEDEDGPGDDDLPERPAYDGGTSAADLRKLMGEAGLQYRVGMSKGDMIAALDEFYGSDQQPPDLQPEAPVT